MLNAQHQLTSLGFNKTAYEYTVDPVSFALTQQQVANPESLRNTAALFQRTYELYYSDRWMPAGDSRDSATH